MLWITTVQQLCIWLVKEDMAVLRWVHIHDSFGFEQLWPKVLTVETPPFDPPVIGQTGSLFQAPR